MWVIKVHLGTSYMPVCISVKPFKRQPWKTSDFSTKGVRRPLKLLRIEFSHPPPPTPPPTNFFGRIQSEVPRNYIAQEHLLDNTFIIIITSFYVDLVITFGNCFLIITSNDSQRKIQDHVN